MARFSVLFVVFIDILGLGLLIPILSEILLEPAQEFLASSVSEGNRAFYYGAVLGAFFLSWFFGAAFISKLSDYIGRKSAILVCLCGALAGYLLTFLALELSSLPLLVAGRVVAGFTAGNQPIAQAALIDEAGNNRQKAKFMGQMVAAVSLGLVAGPMLTAVLTSKDVIGKSAGFELPVLAAALLVAVNIALIISFFHETLPERRKIDFGVNEVFLTLLRVFQHPATLRLAPVFFFAVMGFNAFYLFLDDFLIARFNFGTFQNSAVLIVFGATMGSVSLFLVGPVFERFRQSAIIAVTVTTMIVFMAGYLVNHEAWLAYVLVVPIIAAFGITYPTFLSMFSASVDASRQGWAMGVCVALYTLGSGSISIAGGTMMALNPALPLLVAIGSCILALVFMALLWRGHDAIATLDPVTPGRGGT